MTPPSAQIDVDCCSSFFSTLDNTADISPWMILILMGSFSFFQCLFPDEIAHLGSSPRPVLIFNLWFFFFLFFRKPVYHQQLIFHVEQLTEFGLLPRGAKNNNKLTKNKQKKQQIFYSHGWRCNRSERFGCSGSFGLYTLKRARTYVTGTLETEEFISHPHTGVGISRDNASVCQLWKAYSR